MEQCKECPTKGVEEFCSLCKGNFLHALNKYYCSSCIGSLESACGEIMKEGEHCWIDAAVIWKPGEPPKRRPKANK